MDEGAGSETVRASDRVCVEPDGEGEAAPSAVYTDVLGLEEQAIAARVW